jgi:hypothetical protein
MVLQILYYFSNIFLTAPKRLVKELFFYLINQSHKLGGDLSVDTGQDRKNRIYFTATSLMEVDTLQCNCY